MPRQSTIGPKLLYLLIALAVAGAILWWQRVPLLGWYELRGLARASEHERAEWAERVAGLDAGAVPGLSGLLMRPDAKVCANAAAALAALVHRWGVNDPRSAGLGRCVANQFNTMSAPGREAVLEWQTAVLHQSDPKNQPMTDTAGHLLALAVHVPERGVYLRTLALAEVMLSRQQPARPDLYRELALRGVGVKDNDIRVAAVRLVMHPPLQSDIELVDQVIPLLKHPAAEVRRAALLAVGLSEKQLTVDDLLPMLQDADAEVRQLCEDALRVRGLPDNHIKLAKLITDPQPGERLQVVHYLQEAEGIDPGVWLLRMSQDPSPAVRAAAIRFAADDPTAVDFRERVQQMAVEDPSATVQQLARFYLTKLN